MNPTPSPAKTALPSTHDPSHDPHLADIEADLHAGLPHQRERLRRARRRQELWALRDDPATRHGWGETIRERTEKPRRPLPVLRGVVTLLTSHLYNPGPTRTLQANPLSDGFDLQQPSSDVGLTVANAFCREVYAHNQIDALMQAADISATLHGAAAIGVHATGDPVRPIRLDLYGGDEFVVWTPDDDPAHPFALCALSRDRQRRRDRYELWTARRRRVYLGSQPQAAPLAHLPTTSESVPQRTVELIEDAPNPYGRLPFAFAHDELVTRDFWDGGLGDFLADLDREIDREWSQLAWIGQFDLPIGFLRDASPTVRLIARPGHFNPLVAARPGEKPDAFYLRSEYDPTRRLDGLERYLFLALELLGVPRAAIRLEQGRSPSGAALVAEHWPLLTRARRRRDLFAVLEADLLATMLHCAGTWYRQDHLIHAAQSTRLHLEWSEPIAPIVQIPSQTS
jgi:hypothetical protein